VESERGQIEKAVGSLIDTGPAHEYLLKPDFTPKIPAAVSRPCIDIAASR